MPLGHQAACRAAVARCLRGPYANRFSRSCRTRTPAEETDLSHGGHGGINTRRRNGRVKTRPTAAGGGFRLTRRRSACEQADCRTLSVLRVLRVLRGEPRGAVESRYSIAL